MLVEVELESLVGVVDAELLEAVRVEVLEAEYVEDGDGGRRGGGGGGGGGGVYLLASDYAVDALDEPREEARVERLGESIARIQRLLHIQGGEHAFIARLCYLVRELLTQCSLAQAEQMRSPLDLGIGAYINTVVLLILTNRRKMRWWR